MGDILTTKSYVSVLLLQGTALGKESLSGTMLPLGCKPFSVLWNCRPQSSLVSAQCRLASHLRQQPIPCVSEEGQRNLLVISP